MLLPIPPALVTVVDGLDKVEGNDEKLHSLRKEVWSTGKAAVFCVVV